jgi:sugar/nucleoside kinase (ribokinase family)
MIQKTLDAVAFGTCYIDFNVASYPFDSAGIAPETELIGGAYETVPGGSAVNFCRLLGELGMRTAFIGMTGAGPNGELLERLLDDHAVEPALIQRHDLTTNISFNMTNAQGEHIQLVAGTANAALGPSDVLPKLDEMLPQANTLYVGGCFKLLAFRSAFGEIANLARQHTTDLVVDHGRVPKEAHPEMLNAVRELVVRATYYLPSRNEFCTLWEVADIEAGLRKLKELAPDLTVIVKDGANGAFYLADHAVEQIAAQKIKHPVHLTGAGDSFNAGAMAALAKGYGLAEAIAFACRVAAAKIEAEELPRPR